MEDAAIPAAVDEEPEALAVFYRRHVAGLLGYLMRRPESRSRPARPCTGGQSAR